MVEHLTFNQVVVGSIPTCLIRLRGSEMQINTASQNFSYEKKVVTEGVILVTGNGYLILIS